MRLTLCTILGADPALLLYFLVNLGLFAKKTPKVRTEQPKRESCGDEALTDTVMEIQKFFDLKEKALLPKKNSLQKLNIWDCRCWKGKTCLILKAECFEKLSALPNTKEAAPRADKRRFQKEEAKNERRSFLLL